MNENSPKASSKSILVGWSITGPPRLLNRLELSPLLPAARTSVVGIDPLSFVPQQYSDNGLLSVARNLDPCRLKWLLKVDDCLPKDTLDNDIIFYKLSCIEGGKWDDEQVMMVDNLVFRVPRILCGCPM